jgi:hypothetical protein
MLGRMSGRMQILPATREAFTHALAAWAAKHHWNLISCPLFIY